MNDPDRVREWLARWEAADDDLAILVDTGGRVTVGDLRELTKQANANLEEIRGLLRRAFTPS